MASSEAAMATTARRRRFGWNGHGFISVCLGRKYADGATFRAVRARVKFCEAAYCTASTTRPESSSELVSSFGFDSNTAEA